jgi:hypothetical protein
MIMTSLAERVRQDVHLAILQILAECTGYTQNHSILRIAVESAVGTSVTVSEICARLAWLENNALITTEHINSGLGDFVKAKLTDKGLSVAAGEDVCHGVSRPAPDSL